MSAPEHDDISLVIPTYNRADALRANLRAMLAIRGVGEVIVIDDGSTDGTAEVCRELGEARLNVITHPVNRGVAVARNTGVAAAKGTWVLFGEDDCRFPDDYAIVLLEEAERHRADIVGAPLLHLSDTNEDIDENARRARCHAREPSMDDIVFPSETMQTPFLTACALVRRSVFDRIHYYEGYRVNGYREETDFFVQATRAGFRCLLTPRTYFYQLDNWDGGQHHASSLRYEYWTLRNNWHFLQRHGSWLTTQGHIRGAVDAQLRFFALRASKVASGVTRARLAPARSALQRGYRSSTPG